MPIITISRQFGSGGSAIAERVATRLAWTLVDNEFVNRVAQRADLPTDEVARYEERVPSLLDRLARSLATSAPDIMIAAPADPGIPYAPEREIHKVTQAVIWEIVREDNAVIVGRGAQALLEHHRDALHVFVVAPRSTRVERAAERLGQSHSQAERTVTDKDEGRRRYVEMFYHRSWDDPTHYHLVLNSGLLGYDVAADIVVAAARERGWPSPPASP